MNENLSAECTFLLVALVASLLFPPKLLHTLSFNVFPYVYVGELPPVLWEGADGYKHGRGAEDRRPPAGAEAQHSAVLCGLRRKWTGGRGRSCG